MSECERLTEHVASELARLGYVTPETRDAIDTHARTWGRRTHDHSPLRNVRATAARMMQQRHATAHREAVTPCGWCGTQSCTEHPHERLARLWRERQGVTS